jgi:hypothetical protein
LDALRTHIASVALLACHARRSLNALRSRRTNCTGWTRYALDALHSSLARRAGWTALASVALRARYALDALHSSLARRAGWTALASVALRAGNAWNALRTRNARWSRWTNGTSDTGNPLRSYIAAITLRALRTCRPSGTGFASRTGYTRRSLRTSHASHSLRSLRTSKANLRPRRKIDSKPPELVVRQREHEHPGFTPQLRNRVSLSDVGDATEPTLAVPCLVGSVRVSRVERHDRREYVSSFDLRHVTTRLTVPVIGYVER